MCYLTRWEGSISSIANRRIQLPLASDASCSKALCPALGHRAAIPQHCHCQQDCCSESVAVNSAKEAQLTPSPQKGTQQ